MLNFLSTLTNDFSNIGSNFQNPLFIVDYIISVLVVISLAIFIFKFIKSNIIKFTYSFLFCLILASITCGFDKCTLISLVALIIVTMVIVILTGNEIRSVLRDEFHISGIFNIKKNNVEKSSSYELCDELANAIIAMSYEKCGALICIEREDRITTDNFSRWSDLKAQATNELLRTIFYKGTPLHDGATIIREGQIIRAGVIFDSVSVSNKAMPGYLGSRHRAALGITEGHDCISITVSEETGSIHIYQKGRLEKCFASNIKSKLVELLKPEIGETIKEE